MIVVYVKPNPIAGTPLIRIHCRLHDLLKNPHKPTLYSLEPEVNPHRTRTPEIVSFHAQMRAQLHGANFVL